MYVCVCFHGRKVTIISVDLLLLYAVCVSQIVDIAALIASFLLS